MGARALIAKLYKSGAVRAVYLHCCGYPEGAGLTLSAHYGSDDLAEAVIERGYISELGPTLAESVSRNSDPAENWGELSGFLALPRGYVGAEYVYLWREGGGEWEVAPCLRCDPYASPKAPDGALLSGEFRPVRSALC